MKGTSEAERGQVGGGQALGLELSGDDQIFRTLKITVGVLVRFSRETEPVGCMCVCREIYFEEFALEIVEAGKSIICRVGWQAGNLGRGCNLDPKAAS